MIALALLLALAQDADCFPLKAGNEWTYTVTPAGTVTLRVTGTAAVKGVDCVILETDAGGQKTREWLTLGADGLKTHKVENGLGAQEFDPPLVRARFPFKKGEAWEVTTTEAGQKYVWRYVCEGVETVTVAGTAREAVKIMASTTTVQGPVQIMAWYAKGVGLVRQTMTFGNQTMSLELAKTNVKADAAGPLPALTGIGGALGKAAGTKSESVRYESKDAKVLLYHPKGWKVSEGAMMGEGSYAVSVESPDENSGVLFVTFTVGEQLPDSVSLANLMLGNLARAFPTLKVSEMTSTQDRVRTSASVTYTQADKKLAGHLYFFNTKRVGTVYALIAREDLWAAQRPMLTSVVANLAYAPEGVSKVLQQGQQQAAQTPPPAEGKSLHPAVLIKEALAKGGKPLDLMPVTAQDGSLAMAVPKGWTFQGAGLGWLTQSDTRALHGACSVWHTVYTPGSGLAQFARNAMQSQYLPPPQAIAYITRTQNSAKNLRVLSACPETDLYPNANEAWAQARAQGSQVDNRVLLCEFENVQTGQTGRGIFTVTCISYPMGTSWSCAIAGSWAPAGEFEGLIPTLAAIHSSPKQNAQWVQGKFSAQASESKRLNANLMTSLKDLNASYDRYNQSWWDKQKSQDYTSWAYSQTTLGQGSWVSEREGAEVVRSASWGLENRQSGDRTDAVNHTNFTGRNPWSGEQLNEVNTRAEYDKYIRGR